VSNKTICIIPARGGSKRVPRKNVLPLNGIPLIAYTIRAAKESSVFDKILVSTEDKEIAAIAVQEGVGVDDRPEHMAGDRVTKVQVVDEYIKRTNAGETYDNVAALLPTCPFRTSDDVKSAFELFVANPNKDFLIGVVEYDFPIQLALERTNEDEVKMVDTDGYSTTRSQNIAKRYHPNGAIYLATIQGFKDKGTFFNEDMLAYEMPATRSYDIDYPWQFEIAEIMAKKINEL
jgi:CMP-N-acetylneuraminic acid synthetase